MSTICYSGCSMMSNTTISMKYYELLNFKREPFASSPDPALFYLSAQHRSCLQQLELVIRLRRGLAVVVGEVGTGKTTLWRRLLQLMGSGPGNDGSMLIRLFLDPEFNSGREFMIAIAASFGLPEEEAEKMANGELRGWIKSFLLKKGGKEGKSVLLIIDEGQKLSLPCLEVLRELLNYETNERKLIQVLIFAQEEFEDQLEQVAYFQDRIAYFTRLLPLNFRETRELIRHRLWRSWARPEQMRPTFTLPALWLIYRHSRGYPRRIVILCSHVFVSFVALYRQAEGGMGKIRAGLVRRCRRQVRSREIVAENKRRASR